MSVSKLDRKLFTANFKRDYVAFSAVVLFLLIVAGEVFLAVSIPLHFVHSDFWNLQISRQKLLSHFDSLRGTCSRSKADSSDAVEENAIVQWTLNQTADYLRVRSNTLQQDEIEEISRDLFNLQLIVNRLNKNKSFNCPVAFQRAVPVKILNQELQKGRP